MERTEMSEHGKEGALSCLFSKQGMKLLNVRFFRGSSDVISVDEFRREICDSEERKRSGELKSSKQAPRCKQKPRDLDAVLASL
jgi:hypothetical protein